MATAWSRLALALCAGAFSLGVFAQAGAPPLWKVSGPKGAVTLFGTFRLLPPGEPWRTPALERALEDAQVVVFETTPASAQNEEATRVLIDRHGTLPAGQSLRAMLPEKLYADFERQAADLQLSPSALDRMRPWLAAAVLGVQFMTVRGYDPNRGIEAQLAEWARAKPKRLAELETNEAQMKLFAGLTRRQEQELFGASLRQIREMPGRQEAVLAAYRKGDLDTLDRNLNAGLDALPELRRRVLKERHQRWLARIEKMLADRRPHLVIVEVAHLAGPDGLVALLRARGYRVQGP